MHRTTIVHKHQNLVGQNFNNVCSIEDLTVHPIEQIQGDGKNPSIEKFRKLRERYWMKELRTIYPYGLNDRCDGLDWTRKDTTHITARIFNQVKLKELIKVQEKLIIVKNFQLIYFYKNLRTFIMKNPRNGCFSVVRQLYPFRKNA